MPRPTPEHAAAERVRAALQTVPRRRFLPADQQQFADEDQPLPIGFGATNSQPWTVAFMLRHLDPLPGDRVLDVGSGSGWTTALLAELVGETGSVVGVDIIPDLVARGRANLGALYPWVHIERTIPEVLGWPPAAPYQRILVSADGGAIPPALCEQLAPAGRMVIPAADKIWIVERDAAGELHHHPTAGGFSFVPLHWSSD
ncbi:MAG: protein-L-isoaspartate O-methyltransferase family protein [Propioniciclava sp.]